MDNYTLKSFSDGKGIFYQRIKISDNIETEPETGFVYCRNSILGHVGKQAYNGYEVNMPDKKIVYVKREARDVFDEDSLKSIEGKPVTLNHPEEMVTSKNFKKYVVGFVKNVHRDGDNIVGDLVLNDMDAIEQVLDGKLKDLSLGYQARLVDDGIGELVQKDIVVNHVALVAEGRAERARIVDEQTTQQGDDEVKENEVLNDGLTGQFPESGTPTEGEVETKVPYPSSGTPDDDLENKAPEENSPDETVEEVNEKLGVNIDEQDNPNEGDGTVMKDFAYFIGKYNEVKTYPSGEFRDKAYEVLNIECKDTLGVELPPIVETQKTNVADQSLGFADNTRVENKEEVKVPVLDAQAEEEFFDALYRSMDDKETAKKWASMSARDVAQLMKKGEIKL